MFNALILNQQDKNTIATIEQLDESALPAGDVVVGVEYSSLNYKDGLAITGKGKIVREFPMVPGIDYAGHVISSQDDRYQPGDAVILTGWGVGENHWGGMAEKASVRADYLVPMPAALDSRKAMIIGTAGLTAMLCVMALENAGITPDRGEVLVTGASGGVGSVAITLLDQLGYHVVAASGRPQNGDWLKSIGADRVIDRAELLEPARPLEKQLWAGCIDTVGSKVLAKVLAQIYYQGAVAACGLSGGFDLPTTVMPFILRGVKLLGVDSVMCPFEQRVHAWNRVAELLPESFYTEAAQEIELQAVPEMAEALTLGQVTGRTLIRI